MAVVHQNGEKIENNILLCLMSKFRHLKMLKMHINCTCNTYYYIYCINIYGIFGIFLSSIIKKKQPPPIILMQ